MPRIPHDDPDATYINAQHEAGQRAVRTGLGHYLSAGRKLREKKAQVGHGGWVRWMEAHLAFSPRTATRYMAFADRVESEPVSDLEEVWASTRPGHSKPAPPPPPGEGKGKTGQPLLPDLRAPKEETDRVGAMVAKLVELWGLAPAEVVGRAVEEAYLKEIGYAAHPTD